MSVRELSRKQVVHPDLSDGKKGMLVMALLGLTIRHKSSAPVDGRDSQLQRIGWEKVPAFKDGENVYILEYGSEPERDKALTETRKVVNFEHYEKLDAKAIAHPEAIVSVISDIAGKAFSKPQADGDGVTPVPAPDLGVPNFPDAIWANMTEPDRSRVTAAFIEKWLAHMTDRQGQAAWAPSITSSYLAHLEGPDRAAAAKDFLAGEMAATQQRINLMAKVVDMIDALSQQLNEWKALAKKVPLLMTMSIIFSAAFIFATLWLVSVGRLNGVEMALMVFVFALTAEYLRP